MLNGVLVDSYPSGFCRDARCGLLNRRVGYGAFLY